MLESFDFPADAYNWCVVPDTGFDAILFAGIAVSIACLVPGRFANSWCCWRVRLALLYKLHKK